MISQIDAETLREWRDTDQPATAWHVRVFTAPETGQRRLKSNAFRTLCASASADRAADPAGWPSELYFRASLDAASTWLAPVPLSSKPSCPRSASNTIMRPDGKPNQIDRRWTEGGDYHGLIGAGRGKFHAVWSDSSGGVFQIHFATIDMSGAASTDKVK